MAFLRGLVAVLLLGTVAWGQVGTPSACGGAVIDRERLRVQNGRVRFHLRFHTQAGAFDTRSVIRLPREGAGDASCTAGKVVDFMVDELLKERQHFLGP